ncbi:MAG: hypothetical protein A2Y25_02115 [Candidatus Melainabacteria bacterium GWF2_37_15]|nr:MAG: hypothetical protein A2Y25_02115 [Candidatus Melainabacteria bacterium GWF2_37_15]
MRSSLVINIIKSYNKGKDAFFEAVKTLAQEEAKKGNSDIANKLLIALNVEEKEVKEQFQPSNAPAFTLSSTVALSANTVPKDKDSSLDLFEIIEPNISLEDLVYPDEIQEILNQVVNEWKKSEKLIAAGITPTRRILFYGPPGCGKTAAGLALAKKIGLPVAYVRLDSLFSSYLGQTSTNLRNIFDAVKSQPIALFLDEFDAVAKKRDDNQEIGEIKRIVISLLQNFDFLPPNVLVIAATNHHHLLDPAIWRRFDLSIPIDAPNKESRLKLISSWLKNYENKLSGDINLLATITESLSVSRLKDLVLQTVKTTLFIEEKNSIEINDFMKNLILMETFDNSFEAKIEWARKMKEKGIPLRDIASVTGIAKSTLSDHLKNMGED